ncbi:hypothetical protein Slin15195_G122290 [Septoria linicola]|uniref:Uncharacterized protein n=1 Tax=Septoria linicola TaxID=215465 RepID=A0A9Q9B1G2_9PEZI|nr:hypothetical protein Slin14017_G078490 [Septoria linicola]USW58910.1 hypothetical protein Slin15195_G122290 [Septoria linicola]
MAKALLLILEQLASQAVDGNAGQLVDRIQLMQAPLEAMSAWSERYITPASEDETMELLRASSV